MKTKVTLNVKNGLCYKCGIIDNGKITPPVNFVEHLKTLSFSEVFTAIKKNGCCKSTMLMMSLNTESELRRALKNDSGTVEFLPRRGYTAIVLTF